MSSRSSRSLPLVALLVFALPVVRLLAGCGAPEGQLLPDGGSSSTTLAVGASCGGDSNCLSAHCECVDFDCTRRVCAPVECICGYGTSGSCTDALRRGIKDPGDCDGATASCRDLNTCAR